MRASIGTVALSDGSGVARRQGLAGAQRSILVSVTLVYLTVPYAVFILGWLRPMIAVPLVGVIGLATVLSIHQVPDPDMPRWNARKAVATVTCLLLSLLWVFQAGSGGTWFPGQDAEKHNAMLTDLSLRPWPVHYDEIGCDTVLVYYFAFYLPAAFIGKMTGSQSAKHAIFLWTVAGVFLSLLWFTTLVGRRRLMSAMIFVIFSGLDVVGFVLHHERAPRPGRHIEWWADHVQYSSNTTLLFWTPQHAIAGWLATAVIMSMVTRGRTGSSLAYVLALTALWSPLVTIGVLPFVALGLWRVRLQGAWTFQNLVATPLLSLLMATFYLADTAKVPQGWLWDQFESTSEFWQTLLLFYTLEFGLYVPFALGAFDRYGRDVRHRSWLGVSIVVLTVMPLYRFGLFNDLAMRASIPSLFILAVFVARALQTRGVGVRSARLALALLLLVGSCTGGLAAYRAWQSRSATRPNATTVLELEPRIGHQYLGSSKSLFFEWLAPPSCETAPG